MGRPFMAAKTSPGGGPLLAWGDHFWQPKVVWGGGHFWQPKVVRGTTFDPDGFWCDSALYYNYKKWYFKFT